MAINILNIPTMPARIKIRRGDITKLKVEAIVNAANNSLLGGSGVDGAIHRAAGSALLKECRALNGCATGDAKVTGGYNLYAKYVFHTVGPIWQGGKSGEPELLRSCYRTCFSLSARMGLKTIAFPAISSGAYGYPLEGAAKIAIEECFQFLENNEFTDEVILACFSEEAFQTYCTVYEAILESRKPQLVSVQEIELILPDLQPFDDFPPIDFTDMDLEPIHAMLNSEKIRSFFPSSTSNELPTLPEPNSKGDIEYTAKDKNLMVPAPYVPLVRFCFEHFGNNPSTVALPDHNIFESIWDYIQQVVNWAISLEKTLYGQVYDVLKSLDSAYREIHLDILNLENDYQDDQIMNKVKDLPLLFEYVSKLLVSRSVSPDFRRELALAIMYLVSPIDFIPEGIVRHPIALADDVALLLFVLRRGFNGSAGQQRVMRKLWVHRPALLEEIDQNLRELERLLGNDFLPSIWNYLETKSR